MPIGKKTHTKKTSVTHQLHHFRLLNGADTTTNDRLAAGTEVNEGLPQLLGQGEVQRLAVNHQGRLVGHTNYVTVPAHRYTTVFRPGQSIKYVAVPANSYTTSVHTWAIN